MARMRERTLRASASAEATLVGVVLDLAEAGEPVVAKTTSGRTVQGWVKLVARDAIVVESSAGVLSYVPLRHLTSVRRSPDGGPVRPSEPTGDRPAPRETTFANLVADLAADRPRVALVVDGEQSVMRGELRAAGTDVLTVRLDGDPPATVYLATAQLSELTVLASG